MVREIRVIDSAGGRLFEENSEVSLIIWYKEGERVNVGERTRREKKKNIRGLSPVCQQLKKSVKGHRQQHPKKFRRSREVDRVVSNSTWLKSVKRGKRLVVGMLTAVTRGNGC